MASLSDQRAKVARQPDMTAYRRQASVYRATFAVVLAVVIAAVFIVVGLAMVFSIRQVGVSGVVVGVVGAVGGTAIGAMAISNRLVVTPEQLVCHWNFRTTVIPWSEVRSFTMGTQRSFARWPCLVIVTAARPVRIDAVAGTGSFVRKSIAKLEDEQRHHANA